MTWRNPTAASDAVDVDPVAVAAYRWSALAILRLSGVVECSALARFDGFADLTVYDRDPRADPTVLLEVARIIVRGIVIR
jgi:hypothetical protein